MIVKTIEIRDRMTFIPALAVRLQPESNRDRAIFARAGFGVNIDAQGEYVILTMLSKPRSEYDPFAWNDRTMSAAHQELVDNWDTYPSGSVLDVEFVLGESDAPCQSEL